MWGINTEEAHSLVSEILAGTELEIGLVGLRTDAEIVSDFTPTPKLDRAIKKASNGISRRTADTYIL